MAFLYLSSSLPPNLLKAAHASSLRRGNFGAAGTRSAELTAAARCATLKLVDSLPPSALQIWTDGSSLGQPGPSGAGAIVCLPSGLNITLSSALGHGTNNLGELWAIGLGLSKAASVCASDTSAFTEIHVFSDSEYAIGVCSKGWLSKDYHHLASRIRAISTDISSPITFHKVAAHAGIPLNDEADAAAKKGALASKDLPVPRGITELTASFRVNHFDAFSI